MNKINKTLIYVAGPTASGKTGVALNLAKWLKTEIISCDSRQVYQELKIGAAPPSQAELAAVKHHFVQHLSINKSYNAGAFGRDARLILDGIFKQSNFAVLVGGSGLYANALLYGFDDLPQADEELRKQLGEQLEHEGLVTLQEKLRLADKAYFDKADISNPHRVIRALEVIQTTGKKMSDLLKEAKPHSNFKTITLVLNWPREELYQRINYRVDKMVEEGLEEEAKSLFELADLQALNTVGYKEWFQCFNGEISREAAIDLIKRNTRRFAKRQLTWFRRYKDAIWVEPDNLETMKALIADKTGNS